MNKFVNLVEKVKEHVNIKFPSLKNKHPRF